MATKLGENFVAKGVSISQIYSKTIGNAQKLAKHINSTAINSLAELDINTDIIIISISDKALKMFDFSLLPTDSLVCHTSGSVSVNILSSCSNYGIFYPLQTFSKNADVDIKKVPFCIEANSESNLKILKSLANVLSDSIYEVSSIEREKLHLAAVFACNFTNAMYSVADELLSKYGLDFNILRPLIEETAKKALLNKPSDIQTGPAIRNDKEIMAKHIAELDNNNYKDLYLLISKTIVDISGVEVIKTERTEQEISDNLADNF